MLGAFFTVLGCLSLVWLTQRWWRSYMNPVSLGIFAWMPALVMLNFPQDFVSPVYIHQNRELSMQAIYAMAAGFASFWAGCAFTKMLAPRHAFTLDAERVRLRVNPARLWALYAAGVAVFLYAYMSSGLIEYTALTATEVADRRTALHIGPLSYVMLFMDIGAVGFFARFLQTRRWLYLLPLVVAIFAYGLTLQKSPMVWLLVAAIFVSALNPRAFHELLLQRFLPRIGLFAFVAALLAGLAVTNTVRGISAQNLTSAESPLAEQAYIYSGATAIKNLSVAVEGYLPSDGPLLGTLMARPLLWSFLDRETFAATRYFEGINAATYLNHAWVDFRWAGFFINPFVTGVLVMLFFRMALTGSLAGMVFGAIAARAVVFSIGTDVIFEPVTAYTMALTGIAWLLTREFPIRTASASRQRTTANPPLREMHYPPRRDQAASA